MKKTDQTIIQWTKMISLECRERGFVAVLLTSTLVLVFLSLVAAGKRSQIIIEWIRNERSEADKILTTECDAIVGSSFFAVPLCAIIAAVTTWLLYAFQDSAGEGEPFDWLNGTSSWPSIAIMLFAGLLSIHFIHKTMIGLKQNAKYLAKRFNLPMFDKLEDIPALLSWESPATTVTQIVIVSEKSAAESEIDIAMLWRLYNRLGRFSSRFVRSAPMAILYTLALTVIYPLIGRIPTPPIRGQFNFFTLIFLVVFALVLLTFFVIDAILLHEGFLKHLASGPTRWPPDTAEKLKYTLEAKAEHEEELADYWDILLIAERTKAVGDKIYYPFIVLSLLILGRLSFFDNWTWSPALVAVFCSHFLLAFYAAWRLPRIAKAYRDKVLERLKRRQRQAIMKVGNTPEAVNTMIEEITSTHRGAFSYLWEQPVIRAILLPSGGIGLATLLQFLPH